MPHARSKLISWGGSALTTASGLAIAQAPSLGSPQGIAGITIALCGMVTVVAPLFFRDRSEERQMRVRQMERDLRDKDRRIAELEEVVTKVPVTEAKVAVNEGRFEVHDQILRDRGWLAPPRTRPGQRRPRETILVVEDDPTQAKALVKLFVANGFDASFAATMDEAERMVGLGPHWVILDLLLQGEDGLRLLRKIRAEDLSPHVAVVTGTQDPARLDEARSLRPDILMRKPVVFDELMNRIAVVDDPDHAQPGPTP
jgi:CheY-like chemotaxis protein